MGYDVVEIRRKKERRRERFGKWRLGGYESLWNPLLQSLQVWERKYKRWRHLYWLKAMNQYLVSFWNSDIFHDDSFHSTSWKSIDHRSFVCEEQIDHRCRAWDSAYSLKITKTQTTEPKNTKAQTASLLSDVEEMLQRDWLNFQSDVDTVRGLYLVLLVLFWYFIYIHSIYWKIRGFFYFFWF